MSKKIMVICIAILIGSQLFSQDKYLKDEETSRFKIGVLVAYNYANDDNYLSFKYPIWKDNSAVDIMGFKLEIQFPTKYKYLDYSLGSLMLIGERYEGRVHQGPGITSVDDYILNGGGVYFAASPKTKGRIFGLTSSFGVGVFSFKEYVSVYDNTVDPIIDEHDLKASYGLGAISSIGLYLNVWKIGIHPSIFAIYSGGANASFTFIGFELPVTFQF